MKDCEDIFLLNREFSCEIRHIPFKRIFDVLFSLMVLIVGSPIFLLIALSISLSSPGKVIYYQNRVGRGGSSFRCYKFRSMYVDADRRLGLILKNDSKMREEWEKSYKLKRDPRVTPLGAFLRRTSLDELPQFWNVFRGDLSVVGPRPVVHEEIVKYFGVKAYKIFSIRPGITGLWQISGRSNIDYTQRVALDEYYVDKRSALLDAKVILKTIPSVLFTKGAY